MLASPTVQSLWYEAAHVTADAYLDIYSAPPGWREKAAKQTAFIAKEDRETRRVAFLYDPEAKKDSGSGSRDFYERFPSIDLNIGHSILNTSTYLPSVRVPGLEEYGRKTRPRRTLPGFGHAPLSLPTDSEDEHSDTVGPNITFA